MSKRLVFGSEAAGEILAKLREERAAIQRNARTPERIYEIENDIAQLEDEIGNLEYELAALRIEHEEAIAIRDSGDEMPESIPVVPDCQMALIEGVS